MQKRPFLHKLKAVCLPYEVAASASGVYGGPKLITMGKARSMTGSTVDQPESADLRDAVAKMQAQIDDLSAAVASTQDQLDNLGQTVAAHQRLLEGRFSEGEATTRVER